MSSFERYVYGPPRASPKGGDRGIESDDLACRVPSANPVNGALMAVHQYQKRSNRCFGRLSPIAQPGGPERFKALGGAAVPILGVTADGAVDRREPPPDEPPPGRLSRLHVWVYHAFPARLAERRIPFWFFRLKAPAAQYALDGTRLDLVRLGITGCFRGTVEADSKQLADGALVVDIWNWCGREDLNLHDLAATSS